MQHILEIQIQVHPKKLSSASEHALTELNSYNWILFTSGHAVTYFIEALKKRCIPLPSHPRIGAVGDVTGDILTKAGLTVHLIPQIFTVTSLINRLQKKKGLRVLFPRSAIAPHDVVRTLRAQGATVRTIPLYTTTVVPLTKEEKQALIANKFSSLRFKSPSGVRGLRAQLSRVEWNIVKNIPTECIGPTTAREAQRIGFAHVAIPEQRRTKK